MSKRGNLMRTKSVLKVGFGCSFTNLHIEAERNTKSSTCIWKSFLHGRIVMFSSYDFSALYSRHVVELFTLESPTLPSLQKLAIVYHSYIAGTSHYNHSSVVITYSIIFWKGKYTFGVRKHQWLFSSYINMDAYNKTNLWTFHFKRWSRLR